MKRRLALGATAACLLAGVSARASTAEIHVMISGGLTAAYLALAGKFEHEAGHRLITVCGASMGATPTAIPVRLARGEQADIIMVARQVLDALVDSGRFRRESETDLVRSPIGMAVRAGTAVPDIRTVEGLRQTLLAAESIACSDSASGGYVSTGLFQLLGIEPLAAKARKIDGTPVAEIGFQQLSELLPVKGETVVGTIPDAAGRELIDYLRSRKPWRAMRESGAEPIERTP